MSDEEFSDDFDARDLDAGVWVAHYLPQWSSRAQSAATYTVAGSELRLTIPPEQGLWCSGDHEPALRLPQVARPHQQQHHQRSHHEQQRGGKAQQRRAPFDGAERCHQVVDEAEAISIRAVGV